MINNIGCDIVEHRRINLKIVKKVLFDEELVFYNEASNQVEFLASRFAAKEAIVKAMDRTIGFSDIRISNTDSGKPVCNIEGIMLTISHEKNYSIAFAIKVGTNE